MYIYICTHICIYIHVHIYKYIYMYTYMYIYICTHICISIYVHIYVYIYMYTGDNPPTNGLIALWLNTSVVKCKYHASQKQIGFNNKIHWYSILLIFISKFTARLYWTKICVLSNVSN